MRHALVSLHDVTPAHEERVFTAISHLRSLGVHALNLLVVPDFHHRADLLRAPAFCERLQAVLEPDDEIQLHGYFHLTDHGPTDAAGRLLAAVRTAGEGEFQALAYDDAKQRIDKGLDVLQQMLDVRPQGFVPPAWLDNAEVRRAVQDAGLRWCEDQTHIHDLAQKRTLLVPALTWASRGLPRRLGSLLQAGVAAPLLDRMDLVRLAVHPNDYRHPALVASIARVARAWTATHRPVPYREVLR